MYTCTHDIAFVTSWPRSHTYNLDVISVWKLLLPVFRCPVAIVRFMMFGQSLQHAAGLMNILWFYCSSILEALWGPTTDSLWQQCGIICPVSSRWLSEMLYFSLVILHQPYTLQFLKHYYYHKMSASMFCSVCFLCKSAGWLDCLVVFIKAMELRVRVVKIVSHLGNRSILPMAESNSGADKLGELWLQGVAWQSWLTSQFMW